jgi:hypothetical protein
MLPCQPSRRGRAPSGALAEVRHPPVLEGAGLNASARGLLCALASVASQRGNGATDGLGEAPQKRPGNPRNTWNEHPAPLEAECHGAPRCPDPVPGLETLGSASRITSGAPLATPAGVSDRQGSKEPKTEVHAPKIRGPRIRGPRGRGPRIREPRIRGPRSRGPRIRGPKIRGPEKGMGFWLTAPGLRRPRARQQTHVSPKLTAGSLRSRLGAAPSLLHCGRPAQAHRRPASAGGWETLQLQGCRLALAARPTQGP